MEHTANIFLWKMLKYFVHGKFKGQDYNDYKNDSKVEILLTYVSLNNTIMDSESFKICKNF